MELSSALQDHTTLCEQAYQLILEENCLLKTTGQPPNEVFLERKQQLLTSLDTSLSILRAEGQKSKTENQKYRATMEKAQQIILKTLLLDRENEQLLLKCTMTAKPVVAKYVPSAAHLQKLYQRHS